MDFIHMAQFLTKLPEEMLAEDLFGTITAIQMQSRNKKWAQVNPDYLKEDELCNVLMPSDFFLPFEVR